MKKFCLLTMLLLPLPFLAGCGTPHRAPVADTAGGPVYLYDGRTHRVNDGETLYAIAWMYDLDYQALARHNAITPPYTIHKDQLLRVDIRPDGRPAATTAATVQAPAASGARTPQPVTVSPVTITRPSDTRSAAPLPENPSATAASRPAAPPPGPDSVRPLPPAPTPVPAIAKEEPARTAPSVNGPALPSGPIVWAWPASGPLVGRFSAAGVENKGIDIGGTKGQEVLAAADGEVVFAGSGLLRYGEMIILKHNEQYLSAYAHNNRLLVREGERVRRGQKIAELGSTGINRDMLHFEIRLEGKPVDPLRYLPSR